MWWFTTRPHATRRLDTRSGYQKILEGELLRECNNSRVPRAKKKKKSSSIIGLVRTR